MKILSYLTPKKMPEKIRESIQLIRNYQSERTGRKFYEDIEKEFEANNIKLKVSFFGNREYQISYFGTQKLEKLMILKSRTLSIAGYMRLENILQEDKNQGVTLSTENDNIIVAGYPAYQLSCKRKDILLGRTKPEEYSPVMININEQEYPLISDEERFAPWRIKFS